MDADSAADASKDADGERGIDGLRARHAELQRELEACRHALREANDELELLAFGVSHDLRAPIRAIDGFVSALVAQPGTRLDERGQDYVQRIRQATGRMGGLIDGLLELSRVGRAEFKPSQVDLSLLAEWVGAELQDAEPGRPAEVLVQPGLVAQADERLVKLLLGHLLGNAWKFSRNAARVRIEVGGEPVGDQLRVWVRDHGVGFDPEHAGKLFEPFQRLHGSEQGGGHGLGLAVARRIVQRHGGQIDAQSTPGEGSTVTLTLPAAQAA